MSVEAEFNLIGFKSSIERADLTTFNAYLAHSDAAKHINTVDSFTGETLIHEAMKLAIVEPEHWDERVEIALNLINHSAVDLSIQNTKGKTVLDFAYDPGSVINDTGAKSRVEENELRRRGNHLTRLIIARNLQLNLANEATSGLLRKGLGVMGKGMAVTAQALDARLQYYQAKNDKEGVKAIISLTGQINEVVLLMLSNKCCYEDKMNYLNHFTKGLDKYPDFIPPTSRLYKAIGFFVVTLIVGTFLLALNIAPDLALTSWASSQTEAANTVSGLLLLGAGAATYKNAASWSFCQLRRGYNSIHEGANEVCNTQEPTLAPPALDETLLPDPKEIPTEEDRARGAAARKAAFG